MLEQMYWVCADALTLAAQLATAADLPSPEVLRQRIASLFETMRQRAAQVGIAVQDVDEAIYALAAFMDEQILRSPWPGRTQWMAQPLQLVYFQENTAGEGFFVRMQALQRDPRRAHVLEIYFLCLALGFQGRYALATPAELNSVEESVGTDVARGLPPSDPISPAGYPQRGMRGLVQRRLPVVAASIGLLAFAIVTFIILKIVVSSSASSAADEMRGSLTRGVAFAAAERKG